MKDAPSRSNALLLIMFTDPARESAGMDGVGTLVTSIREISFNAMLLVSKERFTDVPALTIGAPSAEKDVIAPPMPRIEMPTTEALS